MANTFTVTLPKGTDVNAALKQLEDGIKDAGGSFAYSSGCGTFKVKGVEGLFTLKGSDVTITINKKPMLATHGLIERKIREYFV